MIKKIELWLIFFDEFYRDVPAFAKGMQKSLYNMCLGVTATSNINSFDAVKELKKLKDDKNSNLVTNIKY
jgi:hypothetical protein